MRHKSSMTTELTKNTTRVPSVKDGALTEAEEEANAAERRSNDFLNKLIRNLQAERLPRMAMRKLTYEI